MCLDGYYRDDVLCKENVIVGSPCNETVQCVDLAICLATSDSEIYTCTCVDGYYPMAGRCHPVIDAEDQCEDTLQCTQNSLCQFHGNFISLTLFHL